MTVVIMGDCKNCGSVWVNDGISEKIVPSVAWLEENGYDYVYAENQLHQCICDACVNHWRTDYCQCGSGEHYLQCDCGAKTPVYFLGGELPRCVWL